MVIKNGKHLSPTDGTWGLFNSLLCQVQALALLSCYLLMSSAQSDDNP